MEHTELTIKDIVEFGESWGEMRARLYMSKDEEMLKRFNTIFDQTVTYENTKDLSKLINEYKEKHDNEKSKGLT